MFFTTTEMFTHQIQFNNLLFGDYRINKIIQKSECLEYLYWKLIQLVFQALFNDTNEAIFIDNNIWFVMFTLMLCLTVTFKNLLHSND